MIAIETPRLRLLWFGLLVVSSAALVPGIIGQVLVVNAGALVEFVGLGQLMAAAVGLRHRRRAQASPARFA
jgi:hypothetical protein